MPCVIVEMLSIGKEWLCSWLAISACFPTAIWCLLHGQQEANGIFQQQIPEHLCCVLSAARAKEGASVQMDFKNCTFNHCNITERCALNHTMCLLVGLLVSSEGQAGGDGRSYCTFRDAEEPCSSVFPSQFQCLNASSLFWNNTFLCVKLCVRSQGYAICKPRNLFAISHPVAKKLPWKD